MFCQIKVECWRKEGKRFFAAVVTFGTVMVPGNGQLQEQEQHRQSK